MNTLPERLGFPSEGQAPTTGFVAELWRDFEESGEGFRRIRESGFGGQISAAIEYVDKHCMEGGTQSSHRYVRTSIAGRIESARSRT